MAFDSANFVAGIVTGNTNGVPPGAVAYWGYLGPAVPGAISATPGADERFRLYFNLHLTEYVEFRFGDMLWEEDVNSGPNSPFAFVAAKQGHLVWLKADSVVQFVRVTTMSSQAAFLRGPIASISAPLGAHGSGAGLAAANSAGCGSLGTGCADHTTVTACSPTGGC